jgi:hypothetical protein
MAKAHWFAGIITTGADRFTRVSAIENSSMIIPNVYLDWISVSAIQNHRLSYCVGDIGVPRRRIGDLDPQRRALQRYRLCVDEPGPAFPCTRSASGTCMTDANSSMICSIERVIISISSSLPE